MSHFVLYLQLNSRIQEIFHNPPDDVTCVICTSPEKEVSKPLFAITRTQVAAVYLKHLFANYYEEVMVSVTVARIRLTK